MRFRDLIASVGALALIAAPTAASAANPAAKLSVAKNVRASAAAGESKLGSFAGGWAAVGALAVVAIVAIVLLESDDDNSDSP